MAKNKMIERTLNTSPVSVQGSVSVGSSTAVTLVAENSKRIYLSISNPTNKTVWIKFQESGVDNIKTGEFVLPGGRWRMDVNTLYTGEVSVIMDSGGANTIHFTEL